MSRNLTQPEEIDLVLKEISLLDVNESLQDAGLTSLKALPKRGESPPLLLSFVKLLCHLMASRFVTLLWFVVKILDKKSGMQLSKVTQVSDFIANYRYYRRCGLNSRSAWHMAGMTLPY